MKIGIDISQIAHPGGVATYTKNLVIQLIRNHKLQIVPFYSSLRKPYKGEIPNVKSFNFPPILLEFLFNKLRVPIDLFIGETDIFHSSDWMQPKTKAKKITTYHDLIPIKFPQWSHPKIVKVHQKRLKIVENEIDMIIAVSESTKQDLLEVSKIPEEKITVIYEAADPIFKVEDEKKVEVFRKKYNLPNIFLLAIGGVGKRRNLENIKKASLNTPLIITGQNIPHLSIEEMSLLYNSSAALVYTSFYEGFGLPILEAMQSGTPVITSNLSSMAEIAAENAFLANPKEINSIKEGIKTVLAKRDYYRKKGLEHSKKFSWEKCAEKTEALYQKLYESP
ncbi:glycosyltransferase family 4 protein [Candidatus Daviesbacteria bacterium]|nr:glycosyltransferase family 4 protein [Candidatus Daviesbacteria bacterium]